MNKHVIALTILLLTACSSPSPQTADFLEVPAPSLEGAEEAVRRQIEEQRRRLESLGDAGADERSAAFGDLGLLYLTYSFLEAAEVCFENAGRLAREDYRWPYLLGYLFQIQGRLEEASAVLERALALKPDDPPALIRLGTVRLELGAGEEARPLFERVLAADPGSAAALDGLGKVEAAAGKPARAIGHFERALELQPTASSVHHALGLAHRKTGDLEKAEMHLSLGGDAPVLFPDPHLSAVVLLGRSAELYLVRAAQAFAEERYDQAESFYRKALEIDPTDFNAHKALGFCLEKLGDVEGAIGELEEALRSATTGDEYKDTMERSEVLRVLGGLRVMQGREQEAMEAWRRALELDPDRLDTRSKLANALARQGRLEEALEHYDRVLAAAPDIAEVRVRRATVYVNLGRRQTALADFEHAVRAAPEDPEVRQRYAEALDHLGETRAAAEQRAAAARMAAKDPVQQARLLAGEGGKLLAAGELAAARERYEQAVDLDPANTDARFQLATILGHLGRFDETLEQLARVITAAPHHGPARRAEVTALLLQGRYGEARERLQKGLEAMPRDRELAHALARLLAAAPVAGVRDGELALRIASRVHQEAQRPDTAETLAMAFAETGRFAEAQELQRQLLAAAERAGNTRMADRWRAQLETYEQARPWRARSPDDVIVAMAAPGNAAGSRGSG